MPAKRLSMRKIKDSQRLIANWNARVPPCSYCDGGFLFFPKTLKS